MDRETASGTKYVFDNGRQLVPQPEGVPLDDLLASFSKKVLDVLDIDDLVVVSGESGLGKSELFLGNNRENYPILKISALT